MHAHPAEPIYNLSITKIHHLSLEEEVITMTHTLISIYLFLTLEQWQRDLCQFYSELEDWRSTAAGCGLDVPELERDTSLGAEEQWLMAHEQWNTLRGIWEAAAESEGVFDQEQTQGT